MSIIDEIQVHQDWSEEGYTFRKEVEPKPEPVEILGRNNALNAAADDMEEWYKKYGDWLSGRVDTILDPPSKKATLEPPDWIAARVGGKEKYGRQNWAQAAGASFEQRRMADMASLKNPLWDFFREKIDDI